MKFRPYSALGFIHWISAIGTAMFLVMILGIFLGDFFFFPNFVTLSNKVVNAAFFPAITVTTTFIVSSISFLLLKRFGPLGRDTRVLYDSFKQNEMFIMGRNDLVGRAEKTTYNVDLGNGIRVIVHQDVEGRFIRRINFSVVGMCFPEFERQTRILIDFIILMNHSKPWNQKLEIIEVPEAYSDIWEDLDPISIQSMDS